MQACDHIKDAKPLIIFPLPSLGTVFKLTLAAYAVLSVAVFVKIL